jgi:hypothetical protein
MHSYLNNVIPAQYADPEASWNRAQTDVDLGHYLAEHSDESFLLPYSEYTRSDVAWVLADGFRYRRSAVNAEGMLAIADVPEQFNVVMTTVPERPRHDGFPAHFDPRLWVLLHDNHVVLLPPFTSEQVNAVLDVTHTTEPEPLIDRSRTTIANIYPNIEIPDLLEPRSVVDYTLDATFNNEIQLLGYTLPSQDLVPGNVTFITLFWKPLISPSEDDEIFVQLWTDDQQSIGGAHDFPWGGMYRTRIWQPDEVVMTHHWIELPANLNTGRYSLIAGLYRLLQNENVPVVGADVDIESQLVRAAHLRYPPPAPIVTGNPPDEAVRFGDLFTIASLNFEYNGEPLADEVWTLPPGDSLNVEVFLETLRQPDRDYSIFLHLSDAPDQPPAAQADQPMGGGFPTGVWRMGERFRDQMTLQIPDDLAPGTYDVLMGVYFWQTGERLPAYVAEDATSDNRIRIGEIIITDQ